MPYEKQIQFWNQSSLSKLQKAKTCFWNFLPWTTAQVYTIFFLALIEVTSNLLYWKGKIWLYFAVCFFFKENSFIWWTFGNYGQIITLCSIFATKIIKIFYLPNNTFQIVNDLLLQCQLSFPWKILKISKKWYEFGVAMVWKLGFNWKYSFPKLICWNFWALYPLNI